MADVFFQSMDKRGPDVVPFIGTAGIGKSCLFLYILMDWFERERQVQSFYYQISSNEIHFFEVTPDGTEFKVSTIFAAGTTLSAEIPLFVDMQEQTLPKTHPGKVFIFSSFQPKRYKEITKERAEYTIPTWSEKEYAVYLSLDHFWTDRDLDREQRYYDLVRESIDVYGGSFRNVVTAVKAARDHGSHIDWKVGEALDEKGPDTAECVFRNSLHGNDLEISDVLIHRNPPLNDVGNYRYAGKPIVFTVASSYVFQKLFGLISAQYLADAKLRFNGGLFRGGEDGQLFEYLCLNLCPILGSCTGLPVK